MDNLSKLPHAVAHILLGDDSEDVFTADQMHAYARAAIEAKRVKLLEAFELEHLYQGGCPDEFSDPRRDSNCPACRALVALGIGEFTS